MDNYLDIAFLCMMINVYFSQLVSTTIILRRIRYKKYWLIWLILFSLIYSGSLVFVDIIHIYHLLLFISILLLLACIYKFLANSLIFLTIFIFNNILMVYLSKYIEFKNAMVIITYPSGLYICILIPLSSYALMLTIIFIKRKIKKANYELNIFLKIKDQQIKIRGYLDSGNTLVVDNLPVIFISKKYSKLLSNAEYGPPINFLTVSNVSTQVSYLGKIILNKKCHDVLISVSATREDFHDCDCLLNLNLIS